MKITGIYTIESKVKPHRKYVGSAVNINNRWAVHLNHLKNNKHSSSKLQRHYNKYGIEDLVFSVHKTCQPDELLIYEQECLDGHKWYFNNSPTAKNNKGSKWTIESKTKFKKPKSEEHKQHLRDAWKIRKLTPFSVVTIEKMKKRTPWNKGKKASKPAWNKGLSKKTDIRVLLYCTTKINNNKRNKFE